MRRLLTIFGLCAPALAAAQLDMASTYDKTEVMIPMRDGVKLFTSIYTPKDKSEKSPILLTRTPYSCRPYGSGAYRDFRDSYKKERFTFVTQDVRGRYMSEGVFADVRPCVPFRQSGIDEATDTYDTIEWLVKNVPNNNGRVGLIGVSYPGFYAAVGTIDSHPALKCSSPQAPVSEWFLGDDFHHNGALFLMDCFNFYNGFGRPRPVPSQNYPPGYRHNSADAYKFFLEIGPIRNVDEKIFKGDVKFWTELMQHPNYDAWWQARSVPSKLKNVKCSVMTVGGLFDAEDLYGAIHTYQGFERNNPGIENGFVFGPWTHGGWGGPGERLGDQEFGAQTGLDYQQNVELPFLLEHLKQKGDYAMPEARVFETGANAWHSYSAWPPKEAKRTMLYFKPGAKLDWSKPAGEGFDDYVSDPAKPVPYVDGTRYGRPSEYMNADQRFASRRPDVLTFRSEPLKSDLRLAGPIRAKLFVAMTGTDADFVVKLIDEMPPNEPNRSNAVMSGYQMLVRGDIMRGKFRNSFEKPEPFVPGKPTLVNFYVPDVSHRFKAGHRVVVQVQSSWFPLADRNPQTFVNIHRATEKDFKKATIKVLRSAKMPSGIEVGVMPAD